MRKILSFLILLATSAFAGTIDRRNDPEPTLAPQYAKRYLYHCEEGQKKTEARPWKDHLAIAKEAVKWKAGGKWQPAIDDKDAGIVSTHLPDLDAKSPEYKNSNLPYDATKEDWSFEGLGLTDDNLPLLYPDSTISEEEVMKLFDEGGGPTAEKPDTPGPAPKTTPYATGTCSLELNQSRTDSTYKTEEYLLEPLIIDNNGTQVGYTEPVTATPDHPYALQSKLEGLLQMTPNKDHHGRVDFVLGQQVWVSTQNDDKKIPYCKESQNGDERNYKCKFTCGWSGGKSSDGSN